MSDFRIPASEIEYFLENGEGLEKLFDAFEKALKIIKDDDSPNFVLGKVVIINDLEKDEDDE